MQPNRFKITCNPVSRQAFQGPRQEQSCPCEKKPGAGQFRPNLSSRQCAKWILELSLAGMNLSSFRNVTSRKSLLACLFLFVVISMRQLATNLPDSRQGENRPVDRNRNKNHRTAHTAGNQALCRREQIPQPDSRKKSNNRRKD